MNRILNALSPARGICALFTEKKEREHSVQSLPLTFQGGVRPGFGAACRALLLFVLGSSGPFWQRWCYV